MWGKRKGGGKGRVNAKCGVTKGAYKGKGKGKVKVKVGGTMNAKCAAKVKVRARARAYSKGTNSTHGTNWATRTATNELNWATNLGGPSGKRTNGNATNKHPGTELVLGNWNERWVGTERTNELGNWENWGGLAGNWGWGGR